MKIVQVQSLKGFTIFDWYNVLKNANYIFCVDSCVANFVNQTKICQGRRFFRPWYDQYDMKYCPKMAEDWGILE